MGLFHTIQPVRFLSLHPFSVIFSGLIFRNEVLIGTELDLSLYLLLVVLFKGGVFFYESSMKNGQRDLEIGSNVTH